MSHLRCDRPRWRQVCRGLSLLELVIVLVILAALTGIAVNSLEPIADQSRYEATQQTLINIDEAIVSQSFTPDRVASYSGFVTDIGRLPVAVGSDRETQLSELWSQGSLPAFSITSFDDPDTTDTESIPVAAGWRGPYLMLPPGPNVLRDGYGRAYSIFNTAGTTASPGDSIGNLVSAGANGTIDSADTDYNRDLELPGGLWTTGRYQGSLEVVVRDSSGADPDIESGETLRVKMYGPVDGEPAVLEEQTVSGPSTDPVSLTFADHTVGPRVLAVYVTTGATPSQAIVDQSVVKQIVLAPGMNPSVQLNLQ